MKLQIDNDILPEKIEAESVTIVVTDKKTGQKYEREIPLAYRESDNGIILSGEDSNGRNSEIVFLSNIAVEKMKNLMGKGPDESHCDH